MAEFPLSLPGEAGDEPYTTSTPHLQRKGNIRINPLPAAEVLLAGLSDAGAEDTVDTVPETGLQSTERILENNIFNNIESKQRKRWKRYK